MVTWAHNTVRKISLHRYFQAQKHAAEKMLRELETTNGKTDRRLINLANEYAEDILGWKGFAPWLHVYSAVNSKFIEGWIPDNYFAKIVLPVISGDYGKLSDHKPLSRILYKSNVFPDIAYFVNGLFLNNQYKPLPERELQNYLFANGETIVFKIDNSMQGKGVYIFTKADFDINRIKILGNGVFQYFIEQHPFFLEIMPSSVATIRLTTYYEDDGDISIRGGYLRVGRSREQSIKWSSNIMIPFDLKTGELNSKGYYPNLLSITMHPDTQVVFANREIPFFNNCCATVVELHKKMPFDRHIGWDLVVDSENNVKVMEWNGDHADIKIHEATQGPCFADLGWEQLWKE